MTGATHRLGGMAAGMAVAVAAHTQLPETAVILTASVLGSLLPDIDNRCSSISCRWRVLRMAVSMVQSAARGISRLLPGKWGKRIRSMAGHRGITHSFFVAAFFYGMAALILYRLHMSWLYAAALGAGVASHIVLDMLSGGVPILMPFSMRRIGLSMVKTKGVAEWIFRVIMLMIFVYMGMEQIIWQR